MYSCYPDSGADSCQIRFLADPSGEFTSALDLSFENKGVFGGSRSKRYAIEVEDGKVEKIHVEPDGTGVDGKSCFVPLA